MSILQNDFSKLKTNEFGPQSNVWSWIPSVGVIKVCVRGERTQNQTLTSRVVVMLSHDKISTMEITITISSLSKLLFFYPIYIQLNTEQQGWSQEEAGDPQSKCCLALLRTDDNEKLL